MQQNHCPDGLKNEALTRVLAPFSAVQLIYATKENGNTVALLLTGKSSVLEKT